MDNSKGIDFRDVKRKLLLNDDVSQATIVRTQDISDDHMGWIADHRFQSGHEKMGDFVLAASIPAAIVEKWHSEGFDIIGDKNLTLEVIMKRLRQEDMEHFIATGKRLF